jgi:hypothetical protein
MFGTSLVPESPTTDLDRREPWLQRPFAYLLVLLIGAAYLMAITLQIGHQRWTDRRAAKRAG